MLPTPPNPPLNTVEVRLENRSYSIQIAESFSQVLTDSNDQLPADLTHALVIADHAVLESWAKPLAAQLQAGRNDDTLKVDITSVPSGEHSKSIARFETLLNWVLECGADRRSVVFAVGGGVVGDLAGFVAASFARGIRFVQIPTTLLAMVDSSVGGKTGINLPGAKNMVGAFWQPRCVLIATEVLASLPQRSYLSGLAEVIKYGVIDDAEFFDWLETDADRLVDRNADALRHAITCSCQSKARVVGADERETSGQRAILNYGHTFAHAIEATAGYGKLLHGEAVSIGMQMAARLAINLGMCEPKLLEQQTELIRRCGLPTTLASADPDEMLPVMRRDKKVAHGKLRFVLPTAIGNVVLVGDVDSAAVVTAISQTQ